MRKPKPNASNGDKCCESSKLEEYKKKQPPTGLYRRHHATVIHSKKSRMASLKCSPTIHATEDLILMQNVN